MRKNKTKIRKEYMSHGLMFVDGTYSIRVTSGNGVERPVPHLPNGWLSGRVKITRYRPTIKRWCAGHPSSAAEEMLTTPACRCGLGLARDRDRTSWACAAQNSSQGFSCQNNHHRCTHAHELQQISGRCTGRAARGC